MYTPEGRLLFDEGAFVANYNHFSARTAGTTGAVVKADAYGTGAIRAVRLLEVEGCGHFFVASLREAIAIEQDTKGRIYVLSGPLNAAAAHEMSVRKLIPVLNSDYQVSLWRQCGDLPCAVQVDTGMQRLGISLENSDTIEWESMNVCLLMTHLACADTPEHPLNEKQCLTFSSVARNFPDVPTSIGNSAGILNGLEFQGDITRPGIGLYGGNPWRDRSNPLETVVTCEGVVIQTRTVDKGDSVGYGASFVARESLRVATVGLGYADGIPWSLSNRGSVAFEGVRMPVIGQISMDATQVDCSNHASIKEGDYVQFIGEQVSLDEVARVADTIPYEVLTNLGPRIQRC